MPHLLTEFVAWELIANLFNALGNILVIIAGAGAVLYLLLGLSAVFTDKPERIPPLLIASIPSASVLSLIGFVARFQTPGIPEDLPVGIIAQIDPQVAVLIVTSAVPLFLIGITVQSVR